MRTPLQPSNNEIELVRDFGRYYTSSLNVFREFGGPSLYFHVEAIREQKAHFLSDRHVEMIYATLASWGMHRMGDPDEVKAKMTEFADFRQSMLDQSATLGAFRGHTMHGCSEHEYLTGLASLESVYRALRVSIARTTLIAHSKVLAHVLPDFVPPIDRQYTIRFFTQDNCRFFTPSGKYRLVNVPEGFQPQFAAFIEYCERIKRMFDLCDMRLLELDPNTFNTSYPKIMDNVIMAFVKSVPKPSLPSGGGTPKERLVN